MHKFFYNSFLAFVSSTYLERFHRKNQTWGQIYFWLHRCSCNRRLVALVFITLAIAATVFTGIGIKNALLPTGSHDFQWTPTHDLLIGANPYAEFLQWQADGHEHTPPHFLNHSPSYPASVYVMLSPLAMLDWQSAKLVWLCINLGLIALLLLGLQRTFPLQTPTLFVGIALLFLCSTPVRASLGAGQHNFLSLAAFIWAWHFAASPGKSSQRLSGLLLSIAWIKYSLTFPLTLLFICRGNWKPVVIASIIHTFLTLIAALQMGMWPHEFFFSSVAVVLMGDGTGFLNLVALSMKLQLPLAVAVTLILAATGYMVWILQRINCQDDLLLLTLLGLFSCAIFYHHGYDFVVLLFGAWAIARRSIQGIQANACAALLALAWGIQWLVTEIAPYLGTTGFITIQITDSLLVVAFYCTLSLIWSNLLSTAIKRKVSEKIALPF